MTTAAIAPLARRRRRHGVLPYLLSLPALLVCIGILIPFFTAVYYSMLRFRLNLPAMKGFIWFDNYKNFLSDPEFWNTVRVSLLYTGLTRDGTFLVENGRVTRALRNFRFNESPLFMLNNLEALGRPERLAGTEAGGDVVMPAIKVRDFNFTSLSEAV